MTRRGRMTISIEGWCYLVVLILVAWAAVVREYNPLVLLAGLLLGPFLISWRLATLSLRRIEVDRILPKRLTAGEPSRVELVISNRRRRLGLWTLELVDQIRAESSHNGWTFVQALVPYVAADSMVKAAYRTLLTRRGRYRFGPLRISTRFPLGLVQAARKIDRPQEIIVLPRMGNLIRNWVEAIEAERTGLHGSSRRRQGVMEGDYYSVRHWRDGDSKRWIHWRTTARLAKPAVRQFEQHVHRDSALILDLWQPARPTETDLENVELAVSLGASMVADQCRRGSRLLVGVSGQDHQCWSAPAGSPLFQQEMLERLALVEAGASESLATLIEGVLGDLRQRSRLVVVSTRPQATANLDSWRSADLEPRRRNLLESLIWLDVVNDNLTGLFAFPAAGVGVG